jgi:hypothetical protein
MPVLMIAGGFLLLLESTLATKIRVNTLSVFTQSAIRQHNISPARTGIRSSAPKEKDSGMDVGWRCKVMVLVLRGRP